MTEYLLRAAARAEVETRERCLIAELLNDPSVPDLSLARARVPPGITTERHALDVDEIYLIEAGHGRMQVGDAEPFAVTAGDAVTIPAGRAQRIANAGDGELRFLCLCRPRFRPESYRPLADD